MFTAYKFRWGTPLCFRIFRTSKTSQQGLSRFSVDFFGLTVLKNFVGNAFNLPELFGYRNFPCMRTENHVLQSKILVSEFAKNSWEPLLSFRILGISETFMRITVLLRFFLSHSTEKLREEPSNVSKSFKCEVSKKNLNKNGKSRFSVENFLAQSAERFRCGTLRYIRKIRLSKNFMPKRVISLFSVKYMSCLLPIKFVGEPLCVSESLGHRKLLSRWYHDSPLIFFGLTVLKNFVGNAFNLPELFGYRNFLCMRTENQILPSKLFVSQYAKISWEPLLSFRILGISETFMRITVLLRFFLSHSTKKLREEPSNVSKSFKCEVSKKILNKNAISRFSVENFLAQSAERLRCGTIRYIRKVRLSKNFMPRRVISLFSVEFCSRILPIKFVGESLGVSESLGHRKILRSVGGIGIFRCLFWPPSTEKFRG